MLKMRISGVGIEAPVQVCVKGKVCQRLPRRLVALDVNAPRAAASGAAPGPAGAAHRRVVADGGGCHHGYAVHWTVA